MSMGGQNCHELFRLPTAKKCRRAHDKIVPTSGTPGVPGVISRQGMVPGVLTAHSLPSMSTCVVLLLEIRCAVDSDVPDAEVRHWWVIEVHRLIKPQMQVVGHQIERAVGTPTQGVGP